MEQLTHQTLAVQVVKLIHQRINSKSLQPGDVLRTELELDEDFWVSRNILREAIGGLRALGIVKGKQLTGVVVGQTDPIYSGTSSGTDT